jgi:hypothetical protein
MLQMDGLTIQRVVRSQSLAGAGNGSSAKVTTARGSSAIVIPTGASVVATGSATGMQMRFHYSKVFYLLGTLQALLHIITIPSHLKGCMFRL